MTKYEMLDCYNKLLYLLEKRVKFRKDIKTYFLHQHEIIHTVNVHKGVKRKKMLNEPDVVLTDSDPLEIVFLCDVNTGKSVRYHYFLTITFLFEDGHHFIGVSNNFGDLLQMEAIEHLGFNMLFQGKDAFSFISINKEYFLQCAYPIIYKALNKAYEIILELDIT